MATYDYPERSGTTTGSGSTRELVRDSAHDLKGQAQEKTGQLADRAKEQARTQLAGQKERATEQLGSISSALHQTSQSLRDQDQGAMAGYIDEAARQVDHLSDYLRNRTVGELLTEAERFARREPALFLGGAMLLGLVGARFFKSSAHHDDYRNGGYEAYRYRERPYAGRSYGDDPYDPYEERPYRERLQTRGYAETTGATRRTDRSGTPDYDTVHGTAGAVMPDPGQTSGLSAGQATTPGERPGDGRREL